MDDLLANSDDDGVDSGDGSDRDDGDGGDQALINYTE